MNYENELFSIPVVVSNYMQQEKYAVTTFIEVIVDKIKKRKTKFSMKKVIYHSDGAGKRFKQKFSICLGTIIPQEFQWHFTAINHGKGTIDSLWGYSQT
ncbi:uncharacterized protein NPIL_150501 [Nephila pilipes]|uniref:Uncharacterized protein n=1 Tax=Nephila pilipes TaxID=299642 RepID=A0A8X6MZB2_NEPPI|nr:uncharacterized protein NPIL_150501 [Nephila pilipes]